MPTMKSLVPALLCAVAGALVASAVPSEDAGSVVIVLFGICIGFSWVVIAQSGALLKGPGALLGQFNPIGKARPTRSLTAFFCSAGAVAGASASILARVVGIL